MANTPEPGELPTAHGGNMTVSEENTGAQPQDKQAVLGSTETASAQRGELDTHENAKHLRGKNGLLKQNVSYECKPTQRQRVKTQGASLKGSSSYKERITSVGKVIISTGPSYPSPEPPVTKATLGELDVPRIVFNPKLRHDVNFDPELHFRPNVEGDSGRRKAQKAAEFWDTFQRQLQVFMEGSRTSQEELVGQEWCLPSILRAAGEILGTLVPPEDRKAVEEILSVEMLMQEFEKGVADLEQLAIWLSGTLKSHCAPMRDDWVDEMVSQLSKGNQNRDVTMLVQGLQTLLSVLEAMKLDVANHQIRCLRPLLIQDTVEFEQTFFMKRIALRKIDVSAAHAWYCEAKPLLDDALLPSDKLDRDTSVFFRGFTNLLLPSRMGNRIPETFMFDEERMAKLRSDVLDAINLDICVCLVKTIRTGHWASETHKAGNTLMSSGYLPAMSPTCSNLGTCFSSVTSPNLLPLRRFHRAKQISSLPPVLDQFNGQPESPSVVCISDLEFEFADDDSQTGSPASSRSSSFSSTTSVLPRLLTPKFAERHIAPEEEVLRRTILAIVEDASGTNRWEQSCPAIALQLLRSSPTLDNLPNFELKLQTCLSKPNSPIFQSSETELLAEFYPLVSQLAAHYANLTSTQLFEVATSTRCLPGQLPPRHALSEVAKQMAHIGTLHWRVWSKLAYLVNPDDATDITELDPQK